MSEPRPDEIVEWLRDLAAYNEAHGFAGPDTPELAALMARKRDLIERIEPGFYDRS